VRFGRRRRRVREGIFYFFFTLMIGAFVLIDAEGARVPAQALPLTRKDYGVSSPAWTAASRA
jgi:hypothetical protein